MKFASTSLIGTASNCWYMKAMRPAFPQFWDDLIFLITDFIILTMFEEQELKYVN